MLGSGKHPRWTLAVGSVLFSLLGSAYAADQVDIVTLPQGSVAHGVGVALAGVVSAKSPIRMIAAGYGGPQILVPLVDEGKASFALLNANDVASATRGTKPEYKSAHRNLRIISNGYSNSIGILVRADSDIRTAADLKGKRVTGVFSAHKTCAKLATATIANAGLTWDDVKVVPVTSTVPSVQALADGRADAALCGAIGMSVIKEVNAKVPLRFVSLDSSPAAEKRAEEAFAGGRVIEVAKGADDGVVAGTNFLDYDFYLVGGAQLQDDLVTQVLEAVWTSLKELREANRSFADWTHERMATASMTIPYHPAAVAFFKKKGVWTQEMEQKNSALLSQLK
jgi:TRAP transporter TAXI family solute receptor